MFIVQKVPSWIRIWILIQIWIQIQIQDGKLNPDPTGSRSTSLVLILNKLYLAYAGIDWCRSEFDLVGVGHHKSSHNGKGQPGQSRPKLVEFGQIKLD